MALSAGLKALLKAQGLSDAEIAAYEKEVAAKANKDTTPKKSGTYTSTQTSARIPDDLALASKINASFKKFHGLTSDFMLRRFDCIG